MWWNTGLILRSSLTLESLVHSRYVIRPVRCAVLAGFFFLNYDSLIHVLSLFLYSLYCGLEQRGWDVLTIFAQDFLFLEGKDTLMLNL